MGDLAANSGVGAEEGFGANDNFEVFFEQPAEEDVPAEKRRRTSARLSGAAADVAMVGSHGHSGWARRGGLTAAGTFSPQAEEEEETFRFGEAADTLIDTPHEDDGLLRDAAGARLSAGGAADAPMPSFDEPFDEPFPHGEEQEEPLGAPPPPPPPPPTSPPPLIPLRHGARVATHSARPRPCRRHGRRDGRRAPALAQRAGRRGRGRRRQAEEAEAAEEAEDGAGRSAPAHYRADPQAAQRHLLHPPAARRGERGRAQGPHRGGGGGGPLRRAVPALPPRLRRADAFLPPPAARCVGELDF